MYTYIYEMYFISDNGFIFFKKHCLMVLSFSFIYIIINQDHLIYDNIFTWQH